MSDPIKEKIFSFLSRDLKEIGLAAMTVDRISRKLSMSKKTIYSRWSTKEELLNDYFMTGLMENRRVINGIMEKTETGTNVLLEVLLVLMSRILPHIIPYASDLQVCYPAIWTNIVEFRKSVLMNFLGYFRDLEKEGKLNPNIPVEQIVYIIFSIIQNTVQPAFLEQSSFAARDLLKSLLKVILEGVLNPGMHNEIEELFATIEEEEGIL